MADEVIETQEAPAKNYAYLADTGDDDYDLANDIEDEPAKKEEPAKVDPPAKPEEPAKVDPPAKVDEPAKKEEPAKVDPPAKTEEKPAEVTATDWKAALKTADKYEALKELGYDDWTINLLKYKEKTGDLTPYLQVKTVDYTKMTPEQLLRVSLQKANEGMSEKALNFKINKELNDKYYLDREAYPEGSEEAEYGAEQLRLDGEKLRKDFIKAQDEFKAPEPSPDLDATKKEADLQLRRATLGDAVMNNEATTRLKTAKSVTYGEGEESFTYPVADIQPLIDTALSTIINSDRNDLKGVDLNIFYKQLVYGANPAAFEKAFAIHHQAIAKDKFQKEIGNITPLDKTDSPANDPELTGAQQLARNGRIT